MTEEDDPCSTFSDSKAVTYSDVHVRNALIRHIIIMTTGAHLHTRLDDRQVVAHAPRLGRVESPARVSALTASDEIPLFP